MFFLRTASFYYPCLNFSFLGIRLLFLIVQSGLIFISHATVGNRYTGNAGNIFEFSARTNLRSGARCKSIVIIYTFRWRPVHSYRNDIICRVKMHKIDGITNFTGSCLPKEQPLNRTCPRSLLCHKEGNSFPGQDEQQVVPVRNGR